MVVSYKESNNHHEPLKECYDVMTNDELKKAHYDPETIKTIRELEQLNTHTPTAANMQSKGEMREMKKMSTIKEAAQQYEAKKTKNVSDLQEINIDTMIVEDREGGTAPNIFKYKAIIVNGEEYRVPGIVLGDIKAILEKKPDLKRISVSRTGTDKNNTKYTVVQIE